MTPTQIPLLSSALCCLLACAAAQEPVSSGYPERDILSPFRSPTDLYAPPDELFRQLRIMKARAKEPNAQIRYVDGREVVDDEIWRRAREQVDKLGIDAGQLAQMMRLHRNGMQRDTAFFGMFYVDDVDYVLDLIAHIPGEPQRATREAALPRAVEFLKAHLTRRFGELSDEQKQAAIDALPEIGSPVAKAQGLKRLPIDSDHLFSLRMAPFFQLLELEEPIDQAQALWFLRQVFTIRPDLANLWLEPALPRLQQLMLSENEAVFEEATGIYRLIGPKDLAPTPAQGEDEALLAWAKTAARHMFPPIRNINDAIVQLFPSEELDRITEAGRKALENSSIGDPYRAQRKDGSWYNGFRVGYVPDELAPLAIPAKAVVTTINGAPVGTAADMLQALQRSVKGERPRRVFVEYVHNGTDHAIEYRIM